MWIWASGLLIIGAVITNNNSMLIASAIFAIASAIFAIAYEIEMINRGDK